MSKNDSSLYRLGGSFVISHLPFQRKKPMKKFGQHIVNFLKREDGPTAVEYAMMLALIVNVCLVAIVSLGTNTNATFTSTSNALNGS